MRKKPARDKNMETKYVGFEIEEEFVVGYGIDFAGKFRGLPYIGYIEHGH